jgi:hypothetical protein
MRSCYLAAHIASMIEKIVSPFAKSEGNGFESIARKCDLRLSGSLKGIIYHIIIELASIKPDKIKGESINAYIVLRKESRSPRYGKKVKRRDRKNPGKLSWKICLSQKYYI